MKIRKKVIILVSTSVIVILTFLYLLLSTIIINGFLDLENKEVRKNVGQAAGTIDREIENLDQVNSDYAEWDDTYQFINDGNKDYVISNLADSTFQRLNINAILLMDGSGRVVAMKGYDLANGEEAAVPDELIELLKKYRVSLGEKFSGIGMVGKTASIISTHSILTSDGIGPSRGMFVMVRYLDDSQIAAISEVTKLKIGIEGVNDQLLAEFSPGNEGGNTEFVIVKPIDEDTIYGYGLMNDISGLPTVAVRVETERLIYTEGMKSMFYLVIALVFSAVVFSVLLTASLDRFFIKKLVLINKRIDEVAADENSNTHVYIGGDDELSMLAKKIDESYHTIKNNLEEKKNLLEERVKTEEDLKKKNEELEKFNMLTVGREIEMVELKKKVAELEKKQEGAK